MGFLGLFRSAALIFLCFGTQVLGAPLPTSGDEIRRFARNAANPVITYAIDAPAASLSENIRLAFLAWDNVATSYLAFSETSDLNSAHIVVTTGSTKNVEEFERTYDSSGEIIFVRWKLHDSIFSQDSTSQLSTLIHEAGHAVGLRHSLNEGAVMSYRRYSATALAIDDEFALTRLYPLDDQLVYPLGCAMISRSSDDWRRPHDDPRLYEYCVFLVLLLSSWLFLVLTGHGYSAKG